MKFMYNTKELAASLSGNVLTAAGAVMSPSEMLQIISLVLTIIGTCITFIIIPLVNWYRSAKSDGKITVEEIKEGVEILKDGIEDTKSEIDKNK